MVDKFHKPTLSVVGGTEGFEHIAQGHVDRIIRSIERYNFARDQNGEPNPKMAMTLLSSITRGVEGYFQDTSLAYMRSRLDQQCARYHELGFVVGAGHSEESFVSALTPLMLRVTEFFAPPAKHLIVDGEYSLLLMLPPSWLPLRRALASLLGEDFQTEVDLHTILSRNTEQPTPLAPYVLVGINGGRALSGKTLAESDLHVEKKQYSYFSLHELCQLFLMRPQFLGASSGGLFEQSEALALGSKCAQGLISLVATKSGIRLASSDEKNIHGGAGVGKPYYTHVIR